MPEDFLLACVKRLRVLALLYAFVFLMAAYVAPAIDSDIRAHVFERFTRWGPGVISITVALIVAGLTKAPKLSAKTVVTIGLVFQVLGSFGIAAAEYNHVYSPIEYSSIPGEFVGLGLSWVAVWMLVFTIVVPSAPRRALLAAIASASAVPFTVGLSMKLGGIQFTLGPLDFFFGLIFPYMLVVLMAYVGARVVYQLGTDVARAREMGSYRLVELLGRGGMGEVWRAKHRMLARPAAIKLVRPEILGAGDSEDQQVLLTRFEREAQATAAMRSPHTIELYDFGVADDGTFYYVAELLDGFDLESLVKQFGPVPAERAIHLLGQVCHSLAEAHDQGLIHRDIKPANIFACRYGRELDFVKVLDFGLVKPRGNGGEDDLKLTAENVASGTPAYMAPEQVMGDPVDARTDIYALGCVAYWLLTGEIVFRGNTPLQTVMQHVQMTPTPPSQRTELEIPVSLENIVLTCLAKDPNERPQSADELSDRLSRCAADVPEWTAERARQWWDTHAPQTQ